LGWFIPVFEGWYGTVLAFRVGWTSFGAPFHDFAGSVWWCTLVGGWWL